MAQKDHQPAENGEQAEVTRIGAFIRDQRHALGISRRELMRRSGVANLPRLELGMTTSPRTDSLQAIADVLGISLSELVAAGRQKNCRRSRPISARSTATCQRRAGDE